MGCPCRPQTAIAPFSLEPFRFPRARFATTMIIHRALVSRYADGYVPSTAENWSKP